MLLEYYDEVYDGTLYQLQYVVLERFDDYLLEHDVSFDCVYSVIPDFIDSTGYAPSTCRKYRSALRRYVERCSELDDRFVIRWQMMKMICGVGIMN